MLRNRTREDLVSSGWVLALLLPVLAGCASGPPKARSAPPPVAIGDGRVEASLILQESARMQTSLAALRQLRGNVADRNRDYFLPREHDLVERTLTNYLAGRDELQRIALACPPQSTRSALGQLAIARRTECDVALTCAVLDDAVLRRALNQAFHRSGIPEGTCDRIVHEVTDYNLVRSLPEPGKGGLVEMASYGEESPPPPGDSDARRRIDEIIRRRSLLLPEVENELWHAPPTLLLAATRRAAGEQYRRCQAAIVTGVGRLKSPTARPLEFTQVEREQIRASLRPGDVLLTYTAGFASNLFIPGSFKHAATFVGTEEDRHRAGVPADVLAAQAGPCNERLAQVLRQTKIPSGEPADVVESLADGVLLNNFDRILTTRINRLVVLRPNLTPEERALQLVDVLSFVGDDYDFSFDLTDGSNQVCTEVVYRSLQGRGGIAFPLTRHAGSLTLTADEILQYQLEQGAGQFECVLIVAEDQGAPGKAKILFAGEGQAWISNLPGLRGSPSISGVGRSEDCRMRHP